jgi:hypothetical protein
MTRVSLTPARTRRAVIASGVPKSPAWNDKVTVATACWRLAAVWARMSGRMRGTMVTARQAARIAAVSSALGEDELVLRRLCAVEHVSRSFTFDLELLSENIAIKHEQLLGQRMTVRYELPGGGTRYFDGFVSQFSCLG